MTDLPPLRPPGAPAKNGEGSKMHFTIPGGALGSMAFLLVQLVGVVIWAANEHSQRVELQHQFEDFRMTMRDRAKQIENAADRLDASGTRALALVEDRQTTNVARFNIMDERTLSLQTRLNGLGDFIIKMEARIDELEKKAVQPPTP